MTKQKKSKKKTIVSEALNALGNELTHLTSQIQNPFASSSKKTSKHRGKHTKQYQHAKAYGVKSKIPKQMRRASNTSMKRKSKNKK